jgi:hypothetical protein
MRVRVSTVAGKPVMALNRTATQETTMDNFLLQALLESTGGKKRVCLN